MPTRSIKIDAAWKKALLAVAGILCVLGAWYFSRWGMASSAAVRAEDPDVTSFLTELAPDDPQTHYSASVLLEKSFEPGDIARSLHELEIATGLAPENYLYWLDLGRARERSGDPEGAERALRRALELAPNYARVQWALGNNLLRQGRLDEAFEEIRKAVNADPSTFAVPGALTARQFLGDDFKAISDRIGGPIAFEAALIRMLIGEQRYDEAIAMWSSFSQAEKRATLRETGILLVGHLIETKKFRQAAGMVAELADGEAPQVGQTANGGFETPVKPSGAGHFEWQIAPGLQPQIVLSSGQKHSGNNSLLIVFNSRDGKDFRTVSQLVAVEPNTSYELELFFRADLKTSAVFKWEVVDADGQQQLGVSDAMVNGANWTPLRLGFKSAGTVDGIIIRLLRENCGQVCAVTGNIGIDDVSLRKVGEE